MEISQLLASEGVQKIECLNLYQDLNVLLAELVGWQNINIEDDIVLVSQNQENPHIFDFFDHKVIFPIAQKYNKKADKISDSEWSCEYLNKDKKPMIVVSEKEEVALAIALVLEFCIQY